MKFVNFLIFLTLIKYSNGYYDQKTTFLNHQLTRIQNRNQNHQILNNSSKSYVTTEKSQIFGNHRLRHHKNLNRENSRVLRVENEKLSFWTTEAPYFRKILSSTTERSHEDFSNSEDRENYEDYMDDDEDDDLDNDDDSSDDDFEDEEQENLQEKSWQAEEATKRPESFTDMKWRLYGSRKSVDESRRQHQMANSETSRHQTRYIVEHLNRVSSQIKCRVPRPRVISVQSVYPDASKSYIPHCTVIHQCGDDSGCCSQETLTCAPKRTEKIQLYFYAQTAGRHGYEIAKLDFVNHTECECVEKSMILAASDRPQSAAQHTKSAISFRPTESQSRNRESRVLSPLRSCRCPELYTPKYSYHRCYCDCAESNRDCFRRKKGKEYFSLTDRKCIASGTCNTPSCEFGSFINHLGRCPRRMESVTRP